MHSYHFLSFFFVPIRLERFKGKFYKAFRKKDAASSHWQFYLDFGCILKVHFISISGRAFLHWNLTARENEPKQGRQSPTLQRDVPQPARLGPTDRSRRQQLGHVHAVNRNAHLFDHRAPFWHLLGKWSLSYFMLTFLTRFVFLCRVGCFQPYLIFSCGLFPFFVAWWPLASGLRRWDAMSFARALTLLAISVRL